MKSKKKTKTKERQLILYEKYKQMHQKKQETYALAVPKKRSHKTFGDVLAVFILSGMAGLSIIGTVALLNPQTRDLLLEMIGG